MKMVSKQKKVKKEWKSLEIELSLIDGVNAVYDDSVLTVKGPKGEISKKLRYPKVEISINSDKIMIRTDKLSQREKKIIFTFRAHVNNMIKGVTQGFEYKLRVVYTKFPMTVEIKGQELIVKNLLGEKVPRKCIIPSDVKVDIKGGKDIVINGIDKEKSGQVAASIEQLTRITHLDRRVIQDGIFITHKPHRAYI